MSYAVVQGCSKGLGHSFARLLLARTDMHIICLTHARTSEVQQSLLSSNDGKNERLTVLEADVTREEQLREAAERVEQEFGKKMGLLANFAGVLHPEKNIASLDLTEVRRTFEINTFGHALMFKHFLPLVPRASAKEREGGQGVGEGGRSVIVSLTAKVGSIEDNRKGGWYSYRASKAATNQLVRTLAHEVEMRNLWATAIAYHPGTVKTGLAGDYAFGKSPKADDGVHEADEAAELMYKVVTDLKASENGVFLNWKHEKLPW
ncbi:NAD(P)-binding protein [Calocera cornea HHB12733]|uniref:NAD(P)-binding protein n=1 Tax=Calocera cornea HHB12733 TaxID=1353952 RepID=A0A165IER6_9BASI|nr:NAD(P)-binding protein [Calocera cornea HHB12733]